MRGHRAEADRRRTLCTSLSRSLSLALLGLLVAAGCKDDESTDVLLVVQAAREQPSKDEAGIIVAIQSLGGHWLELSVSGGTLGSGSAACLPTPTGRVLAARVTNAIVFPDQTEAVITVKLLPDGPRAISSADDAAAGASGSSLDEQPAVGPCGIAAAPLLQVIRPIQRVNAAKPMSGSAGSGGAPPAGGTGGAAGGGGLGADGGNGVGGAAGDQGAAGESDLAAGSGGQP